MTIRDQAPSVEEAHAELARMLRRAREGLISLRAGLRRRYGHRFGASISKIDHLLVRLTADLEASRKRELGQESLVPIYDARTPALSEADEAMSLLLALEGAEVSAEDFGASLGTTLHCSGCYRTMERLCPRCLPEDTTHRGARR